MSLRAIFLLAFTLFTFSSSVINCVEGGFGLYLLGYMGPKAGYMPPPGLYFRNDAYHHPGHVKGAVLGGILEARTNAKISLDILNLTYVTPLKFLGADVGCCAILPIGRVNVHASANVTVPTLTRRSNGLGPTLVMNTKTVRGHQVAHGIADTLLIPLMLGWHVDNLHLLAYQGLFVPTGSYTKGHIANMGQNHFATETDAGFTWLDPKIGTEISAITGVTVNFTNHKIHYRSGSEWHTEFFVGQYLPFGVELGLAGYWYYQLTPDKGPTTTITNGFRGHVFGIAPCISYDFKIGKLPVNANIRYYKETNAKNHLKGDTLFFTVSFPIP